MIYTWYNEPSFHFLWLVWASRTRDFSFYFALYIYNVAVDSLPDLNLPTECNAMVLGAVVASRTEWPLGSDSRNL